MIERLKEVAKPSRIYIFGSAATGKLHRDSDLDLLVILPGEVPDWRSESVRLRRSVNDIDMAMDILVTSEAQAEAARGNRYGIYGPVQRDGKLVYEAPR